MVFSSLTFLQCFLPLCLLAYFLVPQKGRNGVLFLFSLLFYAWGEPVYVVLMLFSTALDYTCGQMVERHRGKRGAKIALLVSVCVNLGLLGVFKYSDFLIGTVNSLFGTALPQPNLPLPIGISFYTFQTMSYVIDVYRGDAPVSKNPINFGTYVALFPQLIAGPIVRYRDVAEQLTNRKETLDEFTKGVNLFIIGLGKKVLIANQMGNLSTAMFATTDENGVVGTWVGIIAYSFQLYFDFSGYSDMACGLGNMLGFEFLKNFNYPYISKSVTEFWRRWHISLSTWFKEYVYIPLGGNRKGVKRQVLNLLIVWGLTGIWHGASWNFVLWGLYYGVLLIFEKFVFKKVLDKLPSAVQHIYTMFIVVIGWGLFYFTDMSKLGTFLGDLFNFGNGICGEQALNLILSYLPLIIAAAVASTPLAAKLYAKVQNTKYIGFAQTAFVAIVLVLCTASLVNQSYNPFLYFRF